MDAMVACISKVSIITFEEAEAIHAMIIDIVLPQDSQVVLLSAVDAKVKIKCRIGEHTTSPTV